MKAQALNPGTTKTGSMDRAELEQLGIWERQVELSKLWGQLTAPVHSLKDNRGRTVPGARVRKTEWTGCWLYCDEISGYQLIEEADVQRWTLIGGG